MNIKLKKKLRNKLNKGKSKKYYELLNRLKRYKNRNMSNEEYIIKKTKESTGITPDLENPKMLFEKILWIKCYYRNNLMTLCTDKYEVKNYIKQKGYSDILLESYGVYENFEDINYSELPETFFLKSTHTSGKNQVFKKGETSYKKTKKKFDKILNENYFYNSREWNYKNIVPRILVEPFLDMKNYVDYKFFVINDKVEYFAVVKDINDEKGLQLPDSKFNLYYPNLQPFDGDVGRPKFDDKNFEFSKHIKKMIEISEDLAEPFLYCRVDFLVSKEKIIFGELTFFPTGGSMILKPFQLEYYYGNKIDLSKIPKKYLKI